MKRKEEIEQKAHELSKIAFPDECNIWARPNIEAKVVNSCCISIAEWADETMIDKICEFIRINAYKYRRLKFVKNKATFDFRIDRLIEDLRKAMESE